MENTTTKCQELQWAPQLAPSYANLFMTKFKEKCVYTCPLQPKLWKRFIDDIFVIWPHGMDSLLQFM